jgi:hypothetical protein
MMATAVSIDITGAFDHVSHPHLLHNMAKRKLGGKWTAIVKSFLTGRSTPIRLPQGLQDREDIDVRIPQGSPLSPLLFMIFNADLVELEKSATPGDPRSLIKVG